MKLRSKSIKNWVVIVIFIVYPWLIYSILIREVRDVTLLEVSKKIESVFNRYNIKTS